MSENKYEVSLSVKLNSTDDDCPEWWCGETTTLTILEACVIVLCILGSFGNLVTVLAILFSSLRYSVNCILIGSQSLAGFLYCSLILSMQTVIFHRHSHKVPENFCSAAGGIRYTLVGVIMLHLSVIALYRFLNVVYINKYRYMSELRQLSIAMSVCWLLPLVFTIPPTFRVWGGFHFQSSILACTFDKSTDQSNRIATVTAGFIVPCLFIIYCYARIGCAAYKSFKRMSRWKGNTPQGKALRLSAMMLCIFFIFFLGTFPYFVLNVSDKEFKYPIHHIWTTMLGWLLYCLNPVVYTLMDTNFRNAYKKILMGDCEKNPVRRAGSTFSRAASV
ncbi:G-protein coupled receptor moody-like [Ruditapes philippinarum]|uniref:G-protein coupled receptor moody-like n=1 Tax=Ruditapes philippinarum TaxID=129788 RepID=UPI00295BF1A0|nr:G-protein coupled receptor moody-like [Ruditapes philippinarum]XP_060588847.1 G-protein coupled receptor moody-like [Ruditapes philippinarum]XP_060588849.1 G-protein coupled receptor moody-like [Ruditapes philippinarum]XP_060588850.1 G-protein coupled receptor moody-like [Ruditapes philippinarum]XP_060588851.1 G-protein coupled receptor moody-like [Ruditapes philippinarum]XP_060588852.1 G-protein coupled receptor moody-like [Ruditapes philippinarum]